MTIDEAPTILNLLLSELHGVDIIFFNSDILFLPIRVDVLIIPNITGGNITSYIHMRFIPDEQTVITCII